MEETETKKKKPFYKRVWVWILGIIILIIVAGSNSTPTPQVVGTNTTATGSSSSQQPAQPSTSNTPTVYKVGDQIKLGTSIVTVNKVEYSNGGQFSAPAAGNKWVDLNVTIQNTDSSQQYVTTMGQMFVRDAQGNSYQVTPTDKMMSNPSSSLDGAIIANSKRTGWVGFEVPKTATGLQFQYNGSMWGGGTILVNLGN